MTTMLDGANNIGEVIVVVVLEEGGAAIVEVAKKAMKSFSFVKIVKIHFCLRSGRLWRNCQ